MKNLEYGEMNPNQQFTPEEIKILDELSNVGIKASKAGELLRNIMLQQQFKSLLKSKGLTYAHAAKIMEFSEGSLKVMLNREKVSGWVRLILYLNA